MQIHSMYQMNKYGIRTPNDIQLLLLSIVDWETNIQMTCTEQNYALHCIINKTTIQKLPQEKKMLLRNSFCCFVSSIFIINNSPWQNTDVIDYVRHVWGHPHVTNWICLNVSMSHAYFNVDRHQMIGKSHMITIFCFSRGNYAPYTIT